VTIRIADSSCGFERESLRAPFGFKGSALTELWQVAAALRSTDGQEGIGVGVQSPLWSDAALFAERGEAESNGLLFEITRRATELARGRTFRTPPGLLDEILPELTDFAASVTGRPDLRFPFVLNALVALDFAAWSLYARQTQTERLDTLLSPWAPALGARQSRLANIPLISYHTPVQELRALVQAGCGVPKIKIGADPDQDGDPEKMLAWDMERLTAVHDAVGNCRVAWTASQRVLYYLDANGRYDNLPRLERLLAHADKIGARERILMIEEPFPEEEQIDVSELPVRVAADESVHTAADVKKRAALGYRVLTLKPIAKTLSMSLRMLADARRRNMPVFCADLTVNPFLVEWNKAIAARLEPLPGVTIGVVESNGAQNYRNWQAMLAAHPCAGAEWIEPRGGIYRLTEPYWECDGGIFEPPAPYTRIARSGT